MLLDFDPATNDAEGSTVKYLYTMGNNEPKFTEYKGV
jgi:hypothetical protein